MLKDHPNVLLFITDGQQAPTVDPAHVCITPNFQKLAERGVRFTRAHTVCPTCSPARSSLMTGLLPHNHGVLDVEHVRDPDQSVLRVDKPHFAQKLSAAGYRTAYYGKWHIERTHRAENFGWQEHVIKGAEHHRDIGKGTLDSEQVPLDPKLSGYVEGPPGYNKVLHWGVTDLPPEKRYLGVSMRQARAFLKKHLAGDDSWCLCVSFSEPNEGLVVNRDVYNRYDPEAIKLPANFRDDLSDRPALYRRQRKIGEQLSEEHWKQALHCYLARITELDDQFGLLMSDLEAADQLENTIVIMLSDHGRYVGGHGFDAHNCGAFEEIYNVPLIVAGPNVAQGVVSKAQVGIHDLCPTICELTNTDRIEAPDSRSLASLLADPQKRAADFHTGYAEYHGTRFNLTQRILWQGDWKFVFNGFDDDELYNLADDPHETHNLAPQPDQQERVKQMMAEIWRRIRDTGDRTLNETHYFSMRYAPVGPNAAGW